MLKFDVVLTLTEEEILDGLRRAELRRASNTRLIVQTVLLGGIAAWSLIAFFGGGMTTLPSLFIGVAALVLIPVMWFVPDAQMKQMARQMAQSDRAAHMWVFEDGLDFGDDEPPHAYFDYTAICAMPPEEGAALATLVLRFRNDDVIVVPRRLLTEEQWQWLLQTTADSRAGQRRHL